MEMKKWFAVYTKPRWEKKIFTVLENRNIEAYCPLNKVRKKWSDRYKWVEEPLFKSYVFVHIRKEEESAVRMINGVVNFVYWLGKPAVVSNRDMERIRKFLDDYNNIQAEPLHLEVGMKVKVEQGIFMDKEAKVKRVMHKKVELVIESIGYRLVAFVDKSKLSVVEK